MKIEDAHNKRRIMIFCSSYIQNFEATRDTLYNNIPKVPRCTHTYTCIPRVQSESKVLDLYFILKCNCNWG